MPVASTKAGAKGLYKEFENYPERQVEELIAQRNAARRYCGSPCAVCLLSLTLICLRSHAKEWRQTAEVAQRKVQSSLPSASLRMMWPVW